jgi:3-hydroxyethyl bacteriochlorophyllide a dehydrogenase
METSAVVFSSPREIALKRLSLCEPKAGDVVLETLWSGISTGTEKMFFEGSMPPFPGMQYPLVPGYESVAQIVDAGPQSGRKAGELVFVPGATCFREAAGLFGATASRLVTPGSRVIPVSSAIGETAVLLALAATAHHAVARSAKPAGLVVGHGVLGRLIARMIVATGAPAPVVWEKEPSRRNGATGYLVTEPGAQVGSPLEAVIDASGSVGVLDSAIARLGRGGEVVLAGFYSDRVSFEFSPAFMREVTLRIASEFRPEDVAAVLAMVEAGRLSLDGLVTHRVHANSAASAYQTAFGNPDCLKMVIDWRHAA